MGCALCLGTALAPYLPRKPHDSPTHARYAMPIVPFASDTALIR